MSLKQNLETQLDQNNQQIQFLVRERSIILQQIVTNVPEAVQEMDSQFTNKMTAYFKQYINAKSELQEAESRRISQYDGTKFWQLNYRIQTEVEDKLKQLKDIDLHIERIINQQFDKCQQMEDIQQTIRSILTKKQPNHIDKAEPYYTSKQQCLESLKIIKGKRQQLKDSKMVAIRDLLLLLQKLKAHRDAHLHKGGNNHLIFDSLVKDLEEVLRGKQLIENYNNNESQIMQSLSQNSTQIENLSAQLNSLLEGQSRLLRERAELYKKRIAVSIFENKLMSVLNIKMIDVPQLIERCTKISAAEKEAQLQRNKIAEGVNTTNQTINIFQRIYSAINAQNTRKKELLQKLEALQKSHREQAIMQEEINEIELQLQKAELKKNRLQKKLNSKADEADVAAYRSIHKELQQLKEQFSRMKQLITKMKTESRQTAKMLYRETNLINEEYQDILSEVVPQVWFRDNDFTKQETIRDLNLYLMRTFNRLGSSD